MEIPSNQKQQKSTQGKKSKGQNNSKQNKNQNNKNSKKKNNNNNKNNNKNNKKQNSNRMSQRPQADVRDVIICLAESVKRNGPPSSWHVYSKYDENDFDYSIIELGQQVAAGLVKNSTDICVRLILSMEQTFKKKKKSEHDLDKRQYVSELRKKIRTVKAVFYEFLAENEVYEQVFEYFQELIEHLNRKTSGLAEMEKILLARIKEYISEKFIDSDVLLIQNAEPLLKTGALMFGRC